MQVGPKFVSDEHLTRWLTYGDMDSGLSCFVSGDYIVTNMFAHRSVGDPASSIWEMEEWCVCSALVSLERLEEAQSVLAFDNLSVEPQWVDRRRFDFGVAAQARGIPIKPWLFARKHSANGTLVAEIQRDFLIYHALDQRGSGEQYEFVHPLDSLDVVRVRVEKHAFYSPTLRLEVHRDYLRDYLAAADLGMVVGAVAHRFRNATVAETLAGTQSQVPGDVDVYVHEITDYNERHWRARSILRRTTAVWPYPSPKPERSPWHCYDLPSEVHTNLEFIADAEGRKCTLDSSPFYLFFRSGVLHKYLKNPNDSVSFHMRSWGAARPAGAVQSIDVGINSAGLVNGFAPDLLKQSVAEQHYWASFSCLPSGPVCEELFQTRMQQNPPHSPGTVDLIQRATRALNDSYMSRFGDRVHDDIPPDD
jgi:hypothetical protein